MSSNRGPVPQGPQLSITLDPLGSATLHEQIERALREQIRSGRLTPATRLPSSRGLAAELGVSRGVVLEAYSQLIAEGYLVSSQGAPTRVAAAPSTERPPLPASSLEPSYSYQFDPGVPDLAGFPRGGWLRSLRAVMREARFDQLGPGDPRGAAELRNELMAYLGRVRGAAPEPEHTIICTGFTQGFAALCRALGDRGVTQVAVEDPGWVQHRLIASQMNLEPVPVPVDEQGMSITALAGTGCEAVITTPAHQFPTGAVLSSERRAELLEWAEDSDGLVIEDDYDAELRYDRGPVGALQGLAPERVAYIGSVSKRLAPALRIGWILSPSWLTGALTYEKAVGDGGAPMIDQLALADFLARGELDRHLRRVRLRYRHRRETMIAALERHMPGARPSGAAAGLYALVGLPREVDEYSVVRAAGTRGVGVEGLAGCRADPQSTEEPALVLGYGNVPEAAIERGIQLLAEALAQGV